MFQAWKPGTILVFISNPARKGIVIELSPFFPVTRKIKAGIQEKSNPQIPINAQTLKMLVVVVVKRKHTENGKKLS